MLNGEEMHPTLTWRRLTAAALAGCAALVLTAPTANAAAGPATAVTKTTLTQYDVYDSLPRYGVINMRSISGTASGLTNTTVDVVCLNTVSGQIDRTLARSVAVTKGAWSTQIWTSDLSGYTCRVVAVESGASPQGETDAARLTWGKSFKSASPFNRIYESYLYYDYLGGNPGNALLKDLYIYTRVGNSMFTTYGTDDSGITRFYPVSADGSVSGYSSSVFGGRFGSGSLAAFDSTVSHGSTTEAMIKVDKAQAFTNYSLNSRDANYTAKSSQVTKVTVDAKTGAMTIDAALPLFKCTTANTDPVRGASYCQDGKTTMLPVLWHHTKTIKADGTTVKIVNTFTSTDKKAHSVVFTQNDTIGGNGFRFGTSGAFSTLDTSDKTGVSGYGAKYDTGATTAITNSIGQVVFGAKASTFVTSSWAGNVFSARWTIAVPAGKSGSVTSAYVIITDDTKAASLISNALK